MYPDSLVVGELAGCAGEWRGSSSVGRGISVAVGTGAGGGVLHAASADAAATIPSIPMTDRRAKVCFVTIA
jgi:hypothetical protein